MLQRWFESSDLMPVDSSTSRSLVYEPQVHKKVRRINNRIDLKTTMKIFDSSRSFRRRSRSSVKQQTKSPHYMMATSCSEGKKGHFQASPHGLESNFDSSDESWSPYFQSVPSPSSSNKYLRILSGTSSFRNVKILINRGSTKSKRSLSNCHQVPEKPTCSSTLMDLKFPEHVELHPRKIESDRISKVIVCSYHHCSLNKHDDTLPPVKRVHRRRRLLKSQKSIRLEGESVNMEKYSMDGAGEVLQKILFSASLCARVHEESHLIQDDEVFGVNEAIEYTDLAEIVFGETSFPERSYQETMNIMKKYSTQGQDTLVTNSKCCNCMDREWDGSTSVRDSVDPKYQSVTTSVDQNDEDTDGDFQQMLSLPLFVKQDDNVAIGKEDDNINKVLSKNEPFAIKTRLVSVEAKCSAEFSSASASNARMELEQNLEEKDVKENPYDDLDNLSCPIGDSETRNYHPTEDAEHNASAKKLHLAEVPREKHRSMWSLIHRHMVLDVSSELDNKLTCGADEDNHKSSGNKLCAAESSDAFLNFSERESMITNQNEDNQEVEVRKLFAIKLVREAIERILLPEVQEQSSDVQSVTNEACTEENFNQFDNKNEECDEASESDEGSITRENIESHEKQKAKGQVTKKAEMKAPKHWSNLKRWILLQRFIKELEKVRKFNPRKPQYLQLEPDPEADKVNLKHQTADERRCAEEWMLDYALQQAISQLAPTQKRKVGLLVTAFETVVPPQGCNIQVTFPKFSTINEEHLQISGKENPLFPIMDKTEPKIGEMYSTRADERRAKDDRSMLKDDDTQKTIVLCQKLDEVTSTSSDKVSMEEKSKQEVKEDEYSKLEPEARINVSKASHEKVECGVTNDSFNGTSYTTSNLHETDMNISSITEVEATESSSISSDENKMTTEAEDDDGTYRRQVNKQKYISMWQMISQHVLSDVVSKVGSELLDGTDEEVEDNKTLPEMNTSNSLQDFSETKDHVDTSMEEPYTSHSGRSFSTNDAVNLIREAVSKILTTPIQDDSSDTQCVTSDILQVEELQGTDHSEDGQQNSTSSIVESLRRRDMTEGGTMLAQETKEPAANTISKEEERGILHAKSKLEQPKSKNWSKLKNLILLKRSIKVLERARKLNPQPPQLLPPTADQEQEKVDLRNQMTDERKKAEQWMLDNAMQHMVSKLTPARKRRVAMLVEAFEAVFPLPEV